MALPTHQAYTKSIALFVYETLLIPYIYSRNGMASTLYLLKCILKNPIHLGFFQEDLPWFFAKMWSIFLFFIKFGDELTSSPDSLLKLRQLWTLPVHWWVTISQTMIGHCHVNIQIIKTLFPFLGSWNTDPLVTIWIFIKKNKINKYKRKGLK